MSTSELHPMALRLLDRMTGPPPSHSRFVGEPIDLTELDPVALGDLWTVARSVPYAKHPSPPSLAETTAQAVIDHGREVGVAFRGAACRDYLDYTTSEAEAVPDKSAYGALSRPWREARFALSRCIDLTFDGLGPAAARFLAATEWKAMPHLAVAVGRLAGCEAQVIEKLAADLAGSPLLVDELRELAALELPAIVAVSIGRYPEIFEIAPAPEDTRHAPSDDPAYAAIAEKALRQAAERVRRIHDGELPYAADKAFTIAEAEAIGRLAGVALDRDESWLPPVLDALFRQVCLAPTAAKTVPSQSVAIALGHAVEAAPTPEAVATLRTVLREIRHAGVKKKLQRNIRGAERGLANRAEIALRLPPDQPVSKQQLKTLTRSLEGGLATGMTLNYDDWRVRLAEHARAETLAASLVWRIQGAAGSGVSVVPGTERGCLVLRDVAGAVVEAPSAGRVMLWHPVDATAAERDAWRERVTALRIKQPFKQVFREHYALSAEDAVQTATAIFAGHVVAVMPFLGLARRERWELDYQSLTRVFGPWTAEFDLADRIYPGRGGNTTTGKLRLRASGGSRMATPVRLGDVPAATLSEILRTVDLLVSVSGYALEGEDQPNREARLWRMAEAALPATANIRKQALERALRDLDGMEDLQFDTRHLRLGPYAIHLATGRVTRDGDPVAIDPPPRSNLVAVPWLPYDEALLETICYTAIEIARRVKAPLRSA
jgi:hypothetical protein